MSINQFDINLSNQKYYLLFYLIGFVLLLID